GLDNHTGAPPGHRVRKEGETLRLPYIVLCHSHDSPSRAEQSAAASEEPQNRMRASTGASLSAPKTGTASRAHAARIDRLLTLLLIWRLGFLLHVRFVLMYELLRIYRCY